MRLPTLAALGSIVAVATFFNGGSQVPQWYYCAAGLGLVGLVYWIAAAANARALDLRIAALLGFTVALCVLQRIPLPAAVLRVVSPASLEIYRAAAGAGAGDRWFPITVVPAATVDATLTLVACIIVFALISDLAGRAPGSAWQLSIPLIAIALLEAVLGILQIAAGSKPGGATGTYQNHNHYAGLLELCLPFAAMGAFAAWQRESFPQIWGWLMAVAAMLVAVAESLSRMGFVAALAGVFVSGVAAFAMERRTGVRRRWLDVAAVSGLLLLVAGLLPSAQFIARFGAGSGDLASDARVGIWRDTLHLVAAFPVFGCGFGAFQSAYMRYQTVVPLMTVNFAHNDYLQLLAELGAVGFLALLAVAVLVYRSLLRRISQPGLGDRYLYAACLGSLVAISLHSLVDFNMYKPANAMVVAWIAGIATAGAEAERRA